MSAWRHPIPPPHVERTTTMAKMAAIPVEVEVTVPAYDRSLRHLAYGLAIICASQLTLTAFVIWVASR